LSIEQKKLQLGLLKATNAVLSSPTENEGFSNAIKIIGETFKVDKVYICKHHKAKDSNEMYFTNYCEWKADILDKQNLAGLEKISYSRFNQLELYENFSQGESLQFILNKLSDELKLTFLDERIKSIILSPIVVKNDYWGFIRVEEFKFDRHFSNEEVEVIKKLAEVFAFSIEEQNTINFNGTARGERLNLIDIESFSSLSEWDKPGFSFFIELFDIYLKDIPIMCSEIDSAIKNKNYTNLRFFAHKLGGSLMHLGVSNSNELCRRLEDAGQNKIIDENVARLNKKLKKDIDNILNEISFLRKIYYKFV
jgi:HPt (histidine-containing phosphotransfer) domain-containing protein